MSSCPMKANFRVNNQIEAFYTGGKVQLSKDGRYMFCSQDDKVNILNLELGKVEYVIRQEDGDEVTSFVVSPDDEILVVAYRNLLIKQWNWKEKQCTRTWKAIHRGPIVSMAFDATSTLLATGSSDFTIKVWDIIRAYCTHSFKGSHGVVSVVEFHPDPEKLLLFSAGDDCKVRVWDLQKTESRAVLDSHNSSVTSLSFSKDGHTLLTGGRDNIVIIWDLGDYQQVKTVPIYEAVEFVMMIPHPKRYKTELNLKEKDGFHFVTAGAEGVLKVWNSKSSRCVYKQEQTLATKRSSESKAIDAAITQAMYCPALDEIALVTYDHNIVLYTLKGFKLSKQFVGYNEEILDVKFMGENSSHIAVASNSEQIRVFEISSHNCQILTGHTDIVLELDVFKKGLMLASCSKDNTVRLWHMDITSGLVNCIAVGKGHTHSVGTVTTARLSSNFLVSGSEDQTIKVWSVPTDLPTNPDDQSIAQLKVKFATRAHDKDINSVAISPNDKLLATGSQDRSAKLWHLEREVMLGSFRGHKRGIWCVRFSPTDQALATSSADGTIKIWALTNFSCVKTFEGHDASVMKVVFLTRGMQLLSCGSDGLLKLWTIKSNECVKTLDEHTHKVWTLTANSEETMVVSGGGDSRIIIWEDCTEVEQEEKRAKMEDQLMKEQQLSNLLHEKKYLKAIGLAITLDQPFKLLGIVKTIMEEPEGLDGLTHTLGKLRQDQIDATLRFAKQWNTNSKHCHVAQTVISIILKRKRPEVLLDNPDMQQTLEGLIPYTERHFQRMNRLLQQAMFVEHTWQMMRRATAPTDATGEYSTLSTDDMDIIESSIYQRSGVKRLPERSGDSEQNSSESSEDEEEGMSAEEEIDQQESDDDDEDNDSELSDVEQENERTLKRSQVKRSSIDDSEGESRRSQVKRSSTGDSEGESSESEAEMDIGKEEMTRKLTRSQTEDKENDVDNGRRKATPKGKQNVKSNKMLKSESTKGDVTSKGIKRVKKTVSSSASSTKANKQTTLDDYISPRRTRSSNITNRLRKTSTSTR
ncbi:transducin beta-like protein 3 [Amphiura filiformis]|uniref:transducin beta-like protein 3 n=1 Tax=Amphiura filiformis TaxID=82378 RepID=UPI003B227E98